MFVVFEGPNKSGKSTLAAKVAAELRDGGISTVLTREPGGTAFGETIREAVMENPALGDFARALAFTAARAQHVEQVIAPALRSGAVVLCDRYNASTEVFQLAMGKLTGEQRERIRSLLSCFPQPDLEIFVLPSPRVLRSRCGRSDVTGVFEGRIEVERLHYQLVAAAHSARRGSRVLVLEPEDEAPFVDPAVILRELRLKAA